MFEVMCEKQVSHHLLLDNTTRRLQLQNVSHGFTVKLHQKSHLSTIPRRTLKKLVQNISPHFSFVSQSDHFFHNKERKMFISRADIGLPVYPRPSVLGGKNVRILRVIHTLIKHNTAHKLVAL